MEIRGDREYQAVCQLQGRSCPPSRKPCGGRREETSGITSCECSHFQKPSGQGSLPKDGVLGSSYNSLRFLFCLGRGWPIRCMWKTQANKAQRNFISRLQQFLFCFVFNLIVNMKKKNKSGGRGGEVLYKILDLGLLLKSDPPHQPQCPDGA